MNGRLLIVCAAPLILVSAVLRAETAPPAPRVVHLECETESTEDYAGVKFRYVIDERAKTLRVSRWGEPEDVVFGPHYIAYRTTGMGLKMNVSIHRGDWRFTMLHQGGVFLVQGGCVESAAPR